MEITIKVDVDDLLISRIAEEVTRKMMDMKMMEDKKDVPRIILDSQEALAKYLHCSRSLIDKLNRSGSIPGTKISSKKTLYDAAEVMAALKAYHENKKDKIAGRHKIR